MTRTRWLAAFLTLVAIGLAGLWLVRARSRSRAAARAEPVRAALADRRLADARQLIERWEADDPRSGGAKFHRAWLDILESRPAEAMDAMRRAVELGHAMEPLTILRAVLLAQAGRYEESEPTLRAAFEASLGPAAEVAEGLTRIYLGTFRLAEIARPLERWMESAPRDPEPYLVRNQVEIRLGAEPSRLIRNHREALRRDPTLVAARLELADLLAQARRVEEADAEYGRVLAREPGNVDARLGAGQMANLKGDLAAARDHFRTALKGDPRNTVALRELALIEARDGDLTGALGHLKAAVDSAPFDPVAHYNYARVLTLSGDRERARREGAATERLRAGERKISELRAALAKRPDDSDLRAEAARWLIEQGHEKEGLEWTELILRQHPGHRPTCRLLADYHAKKGNAGLANYYRTAGSDRAEGH